MRRLPSSWCNSIKVLTVAQKRVSLLGLSFGSYPTTMSITKQQFDAYVKVQMSGRTNMFDTRVVSAYSGLSREQIIDIMKNYSEYKAKFSTN